MWPSESPVSAFIERRQRLQALLDRPAVLVSGFARPRNFTANPYPFRAESHFLYLVGRHLEGAVLLVDGKGSTLFAEEADPEEELWTGRMPSLEELAKSCGLPVRPLEELDVPAHALTLPAQDWEGALLQSEILERDIEPGSGPELEGADVKLADAMIQLRLTHDRAAISQLEQASAATALAHSAGLAATRAAEREAQIRGAMEGAISACGCVPSYNPIVTVHGEVLHQQHSNGAIRAGDLLLADVGAETPEGFAGDVTRTWPVSGKFSASQRELYEVVLDAQLAAIAAVKPGARFLDVHRTASRSLVDGLLALGILRGDRAELQERGAAALFFPHGIGHLIGLDVHDMEDLGDRAGYAPARKRSTAPSDRYLRLDRDLVPGMAVTIEPGFYQIARILERPEEVGELERFLCRDVLARYSDVRGIRIEDDVLVTERGCRVLTEAIPKTVADVEAALAG
ncbi:MAG TPA: aminopeptidase P family protein [Polyangiaceae bacterium]|nr:aminopeptidase P family protein [Polyangiaceae bacterium]